MPADELMKIMDMSGVSGELSAAYVDPQLRTELGNQTVKQQIRKLSNDTGMLMKAVQQDPLVQQLAAMDPAMSKVISSPSALKKIFSPELLDQVQHGEVPDESSMQNILDSANSDGNPHKAIHGIACESTRCPSAGERVEAEAGAARRRAALSAAERISSPCGTQDI